MTALPEPRSPKSEGRMSIESFQLKGEPVTSAAYSPSVAMSPMPSLTMNSVLSPHSFRSIRGGSYLNPTGSEAGALPPKAIGPVMEMVVFLTVVMHRAVHPVVIDASKTFDEESGEMTFLYHTSSTVMLSSCLLAAVSLVVCWYSGGKKQFVSIWKTKPMILFCFSGTVLAVGNYLEMKSLSSIPGAAYQILTQSKIIVTALGVMCLKGVYQTRLQWILLCILMLAMSAYMVVMSSGAEVRRDQTILGMTFAFLKVGISCVGAVISDKYMKVYKDDPTHVHIARFSVGASASSILMAFMGGTMKAGFFAGWDAMPYAVTVSFIVKNASSIYILSLLDSILKNIAESFAVLLIYTYDVSAPWVDKSFDAATFLAVMVVVASCAAYLDSKQIIEKAAAYDREQDSLCQ